MPLVNLPEQYSTDVLYWQGCCATMKLYTRGGDDGTTLLFAGGRVPKTHLRVAACGALDELNAQLGLARSLGARDDDCLAQLQSLLLRAGADLATPQGARSDHIRRIDAETVTCLEAEIDRLDADLPPLTVFILPGGTAAAAALHVARTVCRRAERQVVALQAGEDIGPHLLPCLNRLSDLLFALARHENHLAGRDDEPWES